MHCSRKHLAEELNNANGTVEDDTMDIMEDQEVDTQYISNDFDRKSMDAQYLLKLRAGHNLSRAAIQDIVMSTRSLFSDRLDMIKDKIINALPLEMQNAVDFNKIFSDSLFDDLETEYLQDKFIEENMGYVEPLPVKLGTINKQVKKKGQYQLVEKEIFAYKVPFLQQLEHLLSLNEVQSCLNEEVQNTDKMTDIFDGMYMKKDFFQNHPDALLFSLYFDDFEIVNPIGSHRKKHKLSVFYWTLLNISPEFRFKLQATQLLAIGKTSNLKKFGYKVLLSDFVEGMKKLHVGHPIRYGREAKIVHGALYCVLGDTLAAQLLGGFKEGVGMADKPCRTCEITHTQLSDSLHGSQFALRDEQEHKDRCDQLDGLNKGGRRYWSRKYGVTGRSVLLEIPEFEVTKCILHDPMHILLEGIVKMELQLILSEFIDKKKFFTIQDLNVAIQNFNYSPEELNDRPQIIEKKSLDTKHVLPMTAVEIKQLMSLLPFMIGQFVPENDVHWVNFVRLIQITHLVISPIASEETVEKLNQLIYEHNFHFKSLYPDCPFTPKLHYLSHFADQIFNFGPGRNHWCTRLEAKHGFIKARKWKNFKAIDKSVAVYHQRWMCLQQSSNGQYGSEVYLYGGDHVSLGKTIEIEDISINAKRDMRTYGIVIPSSMMATELIKVRGITYRTGSVLLLERTGEPVLVKIQRIYVVEHTKFLECLYLEITDFCQHTNTFECKSTNRTRTVPVHKLSYKWPQICHFYNGKMHVMLYNVDFVWC
jgi:hypothetical protein